MIGTAVGHYRVTARLSAGGMGIVYRAEHELLGRPAAVKILHPELTANRDIVNRFFNEAKATTSIRHAGIVEVFDFGYLDTGHAYLVMELLDGEPLSAALRRGRLGQAAAVALARGVCSALSAAHAKGIVHRDLKPDNIFLVPDPDSPLGVRPKLLDFGIAKLTEMGLNDSATKTGAVMGTPTYMSPEQCSGRGNIDHRADLYSMGCMLYELVAGRPPFNSPGAGELIGQHLFVQPDSPRVYAPELSVVLEQLIMSLLAKNPAERPGSAAELAQRLDEVTRGGAVGTGAGMPYDASRAPHSGMFGPGLGPLTPVPAAHLTPGGNPLVSPLGQAPSAPPLGAMGSSPAVLGAAGRSGPEAPTMATPYSLPPAGPPSGAMPPLPGMPWPQGAQSVTPGSLSGVGPRRGSRAVVAVILGGLLVGAGVAAAVVLGGDGAGEAAVATEPVLLPAAGSADAAGASGDATMDAGSATASDAASATAIDAGSATAIDAASPSDAAAADAAGLSAKPADAGAAPTSPTNKTTGTTTATPAEPKAKPKVKPKAKPKSDMPDLIEDDI